MSFIMYIFSKKVREEYSRELIDKMNSIDEQMEFIYGKNKNGKEVKRKAS